MSLWDPELQEVVELKVTWKKGYDQDAKIRVPSRYRELWKRAVKALRWDKEDGRPKRDHEPIAPYDALPWSVPVDRLEKSATGFFAIMDSALAAWPGASVGWKVPPPYPMGPQSVGLEENRTEVRE